MKKFVIFDVDGTLVDTVDMHAEAWQRAFRDFGRELDFAAVRSQIGKGGDQLLPVFLNETELAEIGDAVEQRRGEIYKNEFLPRVQAFPKVRELFQRILEDGIKIALASSSPEEELSFYKEITGVADMIEAATSANDADRSKPQPDIFRAAIVKLGNPDPADCIVVGDTPYDAAGARKAGLGCIGMLSGGFSEPDLVSAGCLEIFRDPSDLLVRYETSVIRGRSEHAASPQF